MEPFICGIQQMGIGVPNVQTIWTWYRTMFGVGVRIFEEAAEAPLMTQYTGGIVQSRTATLALSMDGGGGFEIWQYTSRNTEKPAFEVKMGDLGLYSCKIKSRNVPQTYAYMQAKRADLVSEVAAAPDGSLSFFVKDPNGNLFQVVEGQGWFGDTRHPSRCGGVAGSIIGVSNMDASIKLYRDILGYETIAYDETGSSEDFYKLSNGTFRRVKLIHKEAKKGPFAKLLGPSTIELVQSMDRADMRRIFENRFWGDWGFIHLCFDVQGMDALKIKCQEAGSSFTVDSANTFDMGEAGGRFSYIEDPDGAWIEFVETHKVPVIKKIGWYLNLKHRKPGKFLPNWMLKAMGFNRVK